MTMSIRFSPRLGLSRIVVGFASMVLTATFACAGEPLRETSSAVNLPAGPAVQPLQPLPADAATPQVLIWNNGERLQGQLVRVAEGVVHWRSPWFRRDLQVALSEISSIQAVRETGGAARASESQSSTADSFRVFLLGGQILTGRLTGLDDQWLTLATDRAGEIRLRREQIEEVSRFEGALLYDGLRGWDGLQSQDRSADQTARPLRRIAVDGRGGVAAAEQADDGSSAAPTPPPSWKILPGGTLFTEQLDGNLTVSAKLPARFQIDLTVESSQQCQFSLMLATSNQTMMRLETWEDALVVAEKRTFSLLQTMVPNQRKVHVKLFFDSQTRTLSCCTPSGKLLGELTCQNAPKPETWQVRLLNLGLNLTVRRLRVAEWDGKLPRPGTDEEGSLRLTNGEARAGRWLRLDAERKQLVLSGDNGEYEVPVEQLQSLQQNLGADAPETLDSLVVSWPDGQTVSGRLVAFADGVAQIETAWAADRLAVQLDGNATLTFRHPPANSSASPALPTTTTAAAPPTPATPDIMTFPGGNLSGEILFGQDAEFPIGWRVTGALESVPLQPGTLATFARPVRETAVVSEGSAESPLPPPDMLFLKSGDILPCHVTSITPEQVVFRSPVCEATTIASAEVQAVELSRRAQARRLNFRKNADAGLSHNKLTVVNDHTVRLNDGGFFRHNSVLSGDTLRLRAQWAPDHTVLLRVELFRDVSLKSDEQATYVPIVMSGTQVFLAGRRSRKTDAMNVWSEVFQNNTQQQRVDLRTTEADLELAIREGQIRVFANGQAVGSVPINSQGTSQRGVSVDLSLIQTNGGVGKKNILISDVTCENQTGATFRHLIEEESRQTALTNPRFRRDRPPTHLLVSPQGDLLRGKLISMDERQVVFESRLERLPLPRERVAAIVRLDPPTAADAQPPAADEVPSTQTPQPAAVSSVAVETNSPTTTATPTEVAAAAATSPLDPDSVLLTLMDGTALRMRPLTASETELTGVSTLLGNCQVSLTDIRKLHLGARPVDPQAAGPYDYWTVTQSREPDWDIPAADGGDSEATALIGTVATDFALPMINGETFRLSEHAGQVVVLDFWASWCGPCVAALPDYILATSQFPADKVQFVAVNQQESADQVRSFLSQRNLSPAVALDLGGEVGTQFAVTGIPHTVILSPGGVVEAVHVGYQPGTGDVLFTEIQQILDGSWKRPAPIAPAAIPPEPAPGTTEPPPPVEQ